jgi:branched-chain amino acid transport system permease protein
MTFFGYAVSDLTRSWLLYQGVLFVLVMMFMPSGMTGLLQWWRERRSRYSIVELLPAVSLTCLAAILVAAGTVFTVEIVQRVFSEDYRALAGAGSNSWPPVLVFGRGWSPASLLTWALPAALFIAGTLAGKASRYCWRRLEEKKENSLSKQVSHPVQLLTPLEKSEVAVTASRQVLDEMDKK